MHQVTTLLYTNCCESCEISLRLNCKRLSQLFSSFSFLGNLQNTSFLLEPMDAFKIILIFRPAHSCWAFNVLLGLRLGLATFDICVRYRKTCLDCLNRELPPHLQRICEGPRKKDSSDPESPLLQFHLTFSVYDDADMNEVWIADP